MTVRRLFLSAVSVALFAAVPPALVRAEDPPASGDVDTAKHNFIGEVNGNSVFVRSAPREDAYPTMKLDKGAQVTVVGMKFKWLKILPPEGSFGYVQKAYVNKRGSGSIGRATREMIAKVGSQMNQLKTSPLGKIDEGQDVEIMGEQDEWYKIKPPAGTFLYINQSYVTPLRALPAATDPPPGPVVAVPKPHGPVTPPAAAPPAAGPADSDPPAASGPGAAPIAPSTPAPVAAAFDKLEADFAAANDKPIAEQPAEDLLAGYTELLKQTTLAGQERTISEVRVKTLDLRVKAKASYLAQRQEELKTAELAKARLAEREEIQARIAEKHVTFYAVVGTLRVSSIQRGTGTLFRVTDPGTGRTLAYARVQDAKYGTLLNQFVGVKGTLTTDADLRIKIVEQPTEIEVVDPAKVNDTVAAQIVPPSLMPGVHGARTAAE